MEGRKLDEATCSAPTAMLGGALGSAGDPPRAGPYLADRSGREITYLRLSVTDRCNLRCVYCMAERQRFAPRDEILSIAELDRLATVFILLGIHRLRLTGGEPLVRPDLLDLVTRLSRHLRSGVLTELTLTTNGVLLAAVAPKLAEAGVRRVNVSLDSLDPATFRRISRGGDLGSTLHGIEAAAESGLKIKINVVALKHDNARELPQLIQWAHARGFDISLIETMPLGDVGADRGEQYVSLAEVRRELESRWTLVPESRPASGPSRYCRVLETGGTLGFITPISDHFCDRCNRVRVTGTGMLYTCLGRDDGTNLRGLLRSSDDDVELTRAIVEAIARKPQRHDFAIAGSGSAVARTSSMTGG